jgi:hypothetical protein
MTNQPTTLLGSVNQNTFVLGGNYEFTYHDKQRKGTVEVIMPNTVILKLDGDHEGKPYKQFRYDKINK